MFTHPAIEQSAVVGVPDQKYGEEVCAWIKLKESSTTTAEEIIVCAQLRMHIATFLWTSIHNKHHDHQGCTRYFLIFLFGDIEPCTKMIECSDYYDWNYAMLR